MGRIILGGRQAFRQRLPQGQRPVFRDVDGAEAFARGLGFVERVATSPVVDAAAAGLHRALSGEGMQREEDPRLAERRAAAEALAAEDAAAGRSAPPVPGDPPPTLPATFAAAIPSAAERAEMQRPVPAEFAAAAEARYAKRQLQRDQQFGRAPMPEPPPTAGAVTGRALAQVSPPPQPAPPPAPLPQPAAAPAPSPAPSTLGEIQGYLRQEIGREVGRLAAPAPTAPAPTAPARAPDPRAAAPMAGEVVEPMPAPAPPARSARRLDSLEGVLAAAANVDPGNEAEVREVLRAARDTAQPASFLEMITGAHQRRAVAQVNGLVGRAAAQRSELGLKAADFQRKQSETTLKNAQREIDLRSDLMMMPLKFRQQVAKTVMDETKAAYVRLDELTTYYERILPRASNITVNGSKFVQSSAENDRRKLRDLVLQADKKIADTKAKLTGVEARRRDVIERKQDIQKALAAKDVRALRKLVPMKGGDLYGSARDAVIKLDDALGDLRSQEHELIDTGAQTQAIRNSAAREMDSAQGAVDDVTLEQIDGGSGKKAAKRIIEKRRSADPDPTLPY